MSAVPYAQGPPPTIPDSGKSEVVPHLAKIPVDASEDLEEGSDQNFYETYCGRRNLVDPFGVRLERWGGFRASR